MKGSSYRTETGAAVVVNWPNTPDPVDPDAYEVCLNPNILTLEARCEARRQSGCAFVLFGALVAFLAMCLVAGLVLAQPAPSMPPMCPGGKKPQPRAAVIKHLANKYEEFPVAVGILASGFLMEIYASYEGKTWTAVSTAPGGMSCVVAAGENWESLAPSGGHEL